MPPFSTVARAAEASLAAPAGGHVKWIVTEFPQQAGAYYMWSFQYNGAQLLSMEIRVAAHGLSHLSDLDPRVPAVAAWRAWVGCRIIDALLLRRIMRDLGGEVVRGRGWCAHWIADTTINRQELADNIASTYAAVGSRIAADGFSCGPRLPFLRVLVVSPRIDISDVARRLGIQHAYKILPNAGGFLWQWRSVFMQCHPSSEDFQWLLAMGLAEAACHFGMNARDRGTWAVRGYVYLVGRDYYAKARGRPMSESFAGLARLREEGLGWSLEYLLTADVDDITPQQLELYSWFSGCFVTFLCAESERNPAVWQFMLRSMSSDLPVKVSDVERIERVFGQPLAEIEARFNAYCEQQAREYLERSGTLG